MQTDCVLNVSNLSKCYAGAQHPSVSNLTFQCQKGEIVGLLGHNGAGKSTVLKCITGALPFEQGKIEICGSDLQKTPALAKQNFGFVPDSVLSSPLSAISHLRFIADAYGMGKSEREERINTLNREIFAIPDLTKSINSLSFGNRQKLNMLAAVLQNPALFILDEPLTFIDHSSAKRIISFIKDYAQNGGTVLFSTHDINLVSNLCERVLVLSDGEKVADEKVSNISSLDTYFLEMTSKNPASFGE